MDKERRITEILRECFDKIRDEVFEVEQETQDYVEEMVLSEYRNTKYVNFNGVCPHCGSKNWEFEGEMYEPEVFHCHECDKWFGLESD